MEKKDLGDSLILIGIILSIGAIPLYLISAMVWEIALLGFTIDSIIIIIGLTSIIIGGLWAKKSRDYWFVLIGLILILGGLFLESINITTNLIGIQPFIPYPISTIMWVMGIIFAIVGGLMKKE
ncbi:MAG: hypothetical protein ACFFG0_11845 [Candidatus Thorarchaeota archaeon]